MARFDDCNVYLLAFKLSTLYELSLFTMSISVYSCIVHYVVTYLVTNSLYSIVQK